MEQLFEMDRRQWLARAFVLVGASMTAGCKFEDLTGGDGQGALSPSQLEVLEAVADAIMPATDTPGALGVGVPAKLNGMLKTWAAPATRTEIAGALDKIDAAANAAQKKGFAALAKAEREAVLTAHDAAALKKVPLAPSAPKGHPFAPVVSVADNGYYRLKALIMALYYSSEIAMTRELVYEHVPGTWKPSIKADAATRPWASTGPF